MMLKWLEMGKLSPLLLRNGKIGRIPSKEGSYKAIANWTPGSINSNPKDVGDKVYHSILTWVTPGSNIDSECELEKFREATLGNGELLATAMGAYRSRMSANNKSGGTVLNHIADTKFSAKTSRWSNLTKGVPGMDHKWSTMTITAAEKQQDEFSVESKAKIVARGVYHNVPPPLCGNGFPRYVPKYSLLCSGLKFGSDGLSITEQTRAQLEDSMPCTGLLAHPHNEAVFNCEVHGTLDTTKFCLSGCPNFCRVCKGCAQILQRSKTIEGASSAQLTKVRCVCGEDTNLVTLETNMLEKKFDTQAGRILPSPPSAKRSLARADSKMSQSSATNTTLDPRSSITMHGLPEANEEQAADFERESDNFFANHEGLELADIVTTFDADALTMKLSCNTGLLPALLDVFKEFESVDGMWESFLDSCLNGHHYVLNLESPKQGAQRALASAFNDPNPTDPKKSDSARKPSALSPPGVAFGPPKREREATATYEANEEDKKTKI